MIRFFSLVAAIALIVSTCATDEAFAHGVKKGPKRAYASIFTGCEYPSTSIFTEYTKAPYRASGDSYNHDHRWQDTVRRVPRDSGHNTDCNSYETVCVDVEVRDDVGLCAKTDKPCNTVRLRENDGRYRHGSYWWMYYNIRIVEECYDNVLIIP